MTELPAVRSPDRKRKIVLAVVLSLEQPTRPGKLPYVVCAKEDNGQRVTFTLVRPHVWQEEKNPEPGETVRLLRIICIPKVGLRATRVSY